jgi:hypothetical protein
MVKMKAREPGRIAETNGARGGLVDEGLQVRSLPARRTG